MDMSEDGPTRESASVKLVDTQRGKESNYCMAGVCVCVCVCACVFMCACVHAYVWRGAEVMYFHYHLA